MVLAAAWALQVAVQLIVSVWAPLLAIAIVAALITGTIIWCKSRRYRGW